MYRINLAPIPLSNTVEVGQKTVNDTLRFKVEFSEPVFDVDTDDFVVEGDGISMASVEAVSNDGDGTVEVTVNTGMGMGELVLRLVDNDTIVDLYDVPLQGVGTMDGGISSEPVYVENPPVYQIDVSSSGNQEPVTVLLSPDSSVGLDEGYYYSGEEIQVSISEQGAKRYIFALDHQQRRQRRRKPPSFYCDRGYDRRCRLFEQ